jgi:hypothetical protein
MNRCFLLVVCCCLVAVGCGKGGGKYTVTGVIELDGQPVPEGSDITFESKDKNVASEGARTTAGGKYTVEISPGKYAVKIYAPKKVPLGPNDTPAYPGEKEKTVNMMPERYYDKTELSADIDGAKQIDFKLTTKKG